MKKVILYLFLGTLALYIISYYTLGKTMLISKILAEQTWDVSLENTDSIMVHSNKSLTLKQKTTAKLLFPNKHVAFNHYREFESLYPESGPNLLFQEQVFSYLIDVHKYNFPLAEVGTGFSISGYAESQKCLYVWAFFKWIKLEVLSSSQS